MKVLVITPDLDRPGGVAHYYATLQGHLNGQVEYFTVGSRATDQGFARKCVRHLSDYVRFSSKLDSGEYDLIHLNPTLGAIPFLRGAVLLAMATRRKVTTIVYIRGWRWEAVRRWCFRWLFKHIYFHADALIVQGAEFKRALEQMGYPKPIYVETAVVADEAVGYDRNPDRTRNDTTEQRCRILFLARVEKRKGIYEAVDVFRILKQKYPFVTMTVAGTGSELEPVKRYVTAQNTPDIQFVGWVDGDAKHRLFTLSDVFLFPTFWGEGMPNAVLEAMAHGLPAVTRCAGAIGDLFEKSRIGFMTASVKPADLAAGMEDLVRDAELRHEIGRENRELALTNFTASKVAARLEAVYASVLYGERCPLEWGLHRYQQQV